MRRFDKERKVQENQRSTAAKYRIQNPVRNISTESEILSLGSRSSSERRQKEIAEARNSTRASVFFAEQPTSGYQMPSYHSRNILPIVQRRKRASTAGCSTDLQGTILGRDSSFDPEHRRETEEVKKLAGFVVSQDATLSADKSILKRFIGDQDARMDRDDSRKKTREGFGEGGKKSSLPGIAGKIKDFMRQPQPAAAPTSLKLSRTQPGQMGTHRQLRPLLPRIRNSKSDGFEYYSKSQWNNFTRPDGKSLYYTDKAGKCRYIRAPATPVLTVEEIFHPHEEQLQKKQGPDQQKKHGADQHKKP